MSVKRRNGLPIALLLQACAGVSPLPDSMRVDDLPVRELSAAEASEHRAIIDRAIAAVVQRRYDEAGVAAEAALALDPRSARAHAILGLVTLQGAVASDPPDLFLSNTAEARIRLAQKLGEDDPFVGWMHAVLLAQLGHITAAAEVAERSLARASNAPAAERAALLGIAGTYRYELGEERAALPHLQAYVALRPDDATAQFRLGVSLLRISEVPQGLPPGSLLSAQRDAEGAARAFARCAALAPGDEDAALAVSAALLRAQALAEQRRDPAAPGLGEQAAQQLRDVVAKFPASAEGVFRLGVLAESHGDAGAARGLYAQALERDDSHMSSLLNLAGLLDTAGEGAAAAALLERVLSVDAARSRLTADEHRRILERLRSGGPAQAPRML